MGVAEVARLPACAPRKSGDFRYTHPPTALADRLLADGSQVEGTVQSRELVAQRLLPTGERLKMGPLEIDPVEGLRMFAHENVPQFDIEDGNPPLVHGEDQITNQG